MAVKLAADIMIPIEKYPHVMHSHTIRWALTIMEGSALDVGGRKSLPRALLVFDDENHPLGIVRRRDILRGLEPKFLRTMSMPQRRQLFDIEVDVNLADLSSGRIVEAMKEQAGQPVSEIMQPIVATCDHDDHLAKIIYKMLNRDLNLIPVLKDERIVGVLRSVDVFHEVAELLV